MSGANGAVDPGFWDGRRVFLTGHTGFKGSWLTAWLHHLGAAVTGYALAPDTTPALFDVLELDRLCHHQTADVREADGLRWALSAAEPEVVFHLAAQPLVRESYRDPAGTWSTNVTGTINLLEAVRATPSVRVVVVITTDKCYENLEDGRAYTERDALGGYDPYSASKAAAELVCSAWRRSFLHEAGVALATARAGNVLGGGDWAADRLIPDAVRAFAAGDSVQVRYPDAVRPWQHVLEPLRGYLLLAERCWSDRERFGRAFNFGPAQADCVPVRTVLDALAARWGDGARWELAPDAAGQPHEAGLLQLNCELAAAELGWRPVIGLEQCLAMTAEWYRAHAAGDAALDALTRAQIAQASPA
ncbi:MAG: CDP-glucose 4,6-dehydratase [Planctomycetota bacterium]